MSQCGDQNDIFVYVLNVFIGIAIAVYFLPCKKITLYIISCTYDTKFNLSVNYLTLTPKYRTDFPMNDS